MELHPNLPALAPLRGKPALEGWFREFAGGDDKRLARYEYAVSVFIGHSDADYVARKSPRTVRAYQFALVEFFEFAARLHRRVVPPEEVRRKDAIDYAEWLAHRGTPPWDFSLEAEKLKDGDRAEDLAIYETVRKLGAAKVSDIAKRLPYELREKHPPAARQLATRLVDEAWLVSRLKALLSDAVLTRSPKMTELRREDPRAGLARDPIDPDIYTYTVVPLRRVARTTIALRLSGLSSFWKILQRGENGEPAIVTYNVFEDALERVSRGLAEEKREASLSKRPTALLIRRVLEAADGPRLVDKRNTALLWFLMLTGARIEETLSLRRAEPPTEAARLLYPGWLDRSSDPPAVVLKTKGGYRRRIALPSYALSVLSAFWAELERRVPEDLSPDKRLYRYRLLLREPDAPLFPPLSLWGKNAAMPEGPFGAWGYRKTMRQSAASMLLCRISKKAGLTDAERRRIHPHGFRHAAAEAMVEGGKGLREVQAILGHASIKTTEQYLPRELDVSRLSGQDEILDWLARGSPRAIVPAGAPEVITTRGEERRAPREERPVAVAARPSPRELALPRGPSAPARPLLPRPVGETAALVAVGERVSPPSPLEPYEQMAAGERPADLAWSSIPQNKWVAEHYPRLPTRFGLGKESLLPWWNPDAPLPWPVLSPGQAYPEVRAHGSMLAGLEALYDEWQRTAPTKTLALAQWLYYLGNVTVRLEQVTGGAYSWVTFEGLATVDEDIRAHKDSWLVDWFRDNAHTFTVAQKRFAGTSPAGAGETTTEFWDRIREDMDVAGMLPSVPALPDWYFEADPVHAIYERDPGEWRAFERWLGKLTGSMKSDRRTEERDIQADLFERSEEAEYDRARGLVNEFYSLIDEIKAPERARGSREDKALREQARALREYIRSEFNIVLPERAVGKRAERVSELLRERFPGREPPAEKNVFGDARMFQPEAFRIDPVTHTIVHTASFRERFHREHLGRDSECVMRRIARALWEKVRGWEYGKAEVPERRELTGPEKKRELFLTLLAHLAYAVPCPADIEKAMVKAGYRYSRPGEVADYLNSRIVALAGGEDEKDALDEVAADVLETFSLLTEEGVKVQTRRNPALLIRNAERALPHPLRLVAAAYWPV